MSNSIAPIVSEVGELTTLLNDIVRKDKAIAKASLDTIIFIIEKMLPIIVGDISEDINKALKQVTDRIEKVRTERQRDEDSGFRGV